MEVFRVKVLLLEYFDEHKLEINVFQLFLKI